MSEALTLFGTAISEMAKGPHVGGHAQLTKALMERLSEKGLTLEQLADRKMMKHSLSTLQAYCREFGIRFPDYTPSNMRKHVMFVPSGDFFELTGDEVAPVAAALGIVITTRNGVERCGIPAHSFDETKERLVAFGYVAKKGKPAKKPKAARHG